MFSVPSARTGRDSASYFFNQGECKFWKRWDDFSLKIELTSVFQQYSHKPYSVLQVDALIFEKYVLFVYCGIESDNDSNVLRFRGLEYSTHNNPPSAITI